MHVNQKWFYHLSASRVCWLGGARFLAWLDVSSSILGWVTLTYLVACRETFVWLVHAIKGSLSKGDSKGFYLDEVPTLKKNNKKLVLFFWYSLNKGVFIFFSPLPFNWYWFCFFFFFFPWENVWYLLSFNHSRLFNSSRVCQSFYLYMKTIKLWPPFFFFFFSKSLINHVQYFFSTNIKQ